MTQVRRDESGRYYAEAESEHDAQRAIYVRQCVAAALAGEEGPRQFPQVVAVGFDWWREA